MEKSELLNTIAKCLSRHYKLRTDVLAELANIVGKYESEVDNKLITNQKYFVVRKHNSCASGDKTDIIGITHSKTKAKSMQSVFCSYEEVKLITKK